MNSTETGTTLIEVPGSPDDARTRAAAVAAETHREVMPVRLFEQGDRQMLSGVLPVRVLTRVLDHHASEKGTVSSKALQTRNRPVVTDHVRTIAQYLQRAISNGKSYIIPPLTLNSTSEVHVYVPEGGLTPATGYAVLPDEAAIHITDGQHRFLAIKRVADELRGTDEGTKFMRAGVPFMMTIEGAIEQVHQDFADAGRTKPLPSSLLAVYDTRQPANRAVHELERNVKFLKDRIDATSSTLSMNSDYIFLVNQVRQFVKASLMGTPTSSEQAFAESAEGALSNTESLDRWVKSRVTFLNVMAEIIPEWCEFAEMAPPRGADGAAVSARTKAIRAEKRVSMTAAFLNALGVVSHNVLVDVTREEVDATKLEESLRERLQPLASIDWNRSADIWNGNLVVDDRIRTQTPAIKDAAAKLLGLLDS